ncbi:hypothetical protein KDH_07780 [Dictyobacter sp. S3.2.2.5]|uniref:DUF302 domain-containing protein n=1 Tax=Dictyobacter halimunensis TaxID=3026934 RepID=A0ABQ6FIG9_9CHLR|nr:hypothetical protein KDH_07780 [Dictyobacter sp. S3.2.2.5]
MTTTDTPYITHITIEHVVIPSRYSYDDVLGALEARVGVYGNWEVIPQQLATMKATWEQVAEITQPLIGSSGFTTFVKMDQGTLLSLTGKKKRITQYSLGNHLIGVMMIEEIAEIGLYAPPRILVYEDYEGMAFVAYDRLTSLVHQYQNEQVTNIAQLVDQKLDELARAVTGCEQEIGNQN